MNRRRVLTLGGASAALALTGLWLRHAADPAAGIIAVLLKRLDYLRLDPDGLERFARDLVATQDISTVRLRLVAVSAPIYDKVSFTGDDIIQREARHGEERIASLYLMSSDFFSGGSDVTKLVRYLGLYDPYVACSNPFARPMTRA